MYNGVITKVAATNFITARWQNGEISHNLNLDDYTYTLGGVMDRAELKEYITKKHKRMEGTTIEYYTINDWETPQQIAAAFGVGVSELVTDNKGDIEHLSNTSMLKKGTCIAIVGGLDEGLDEGLEDDDGLVDSDNEMGSPKKKRIKKHGGNKEGRKNESEDKSSTANLELEMGGEYKEEELVDHKKEDSALTAVVEGTPCEGESTTQATNEGSTINNATNVTALLESKVDEKARDVVQKIVDSKGVLVAEVSRLDNEKIVRPLESEVAKYEEEEEAIESSIEYLEQAVVALNITNCGDENITNQIKLAKKYAEQLEEKLEEKQARLKEVKVGTKARKVLFLNHLENKLTVTTRNTTIVPSLGGAGNGEAVNSGNDAQIQAVMDALTVQCRECANGTAGVYAASLNEQMGKQLVDAYKEKHAVDIQPISDSLDEMNKSLEAAEIYITKQEGLTETATLLLFGKDVPSFHLAAITEAKKVRDETSVNVEDKKGELQLATERVKGQMNQFFRVLKNKLTIRIGCITAEPTLSEDDMSWV